MAGGVDDVQGQHVDYPDSYAILCLEHAFAFGNLRARAMGWREGLCIQTAIEFDSKHGFTYTNQGHAE